MRPISDVALLITEYLVPVTGVMPVLVACFRYNGYTHQKSEACHHGRAVKLTTQLAKANQASKDALIASGITLQSCVIYCIHNLSLSNLQCNSILRSNTCTIASLAALGQPMNTMTAV